MYNPHETICAISTPPGESALAVVRMTGEQAYLIAEKLFTGELKNRYAAFGAITDPSSGSIIDQVVAIAYRNPGSYTGEDLVEFICHGGYVIPQKLLDLLIRQGARLAEPGEFTLRGFINGKLDLTRAEAVDSIIRSKTEKAGSLAAGNLEGKLSARLEETAGELFELISLIEAEIDFFDDEIDRTDRSNLAAQVDSVIIKLNSIISTYDIGRISEGRARVAIVGAPNVGKSSIFNILVETDRAIVTEIPGTTRDFLSEYINIEGFPVVLSDTAGIRESGEIVEQIGIDKTKQLIEDSDLALFVLDGNREFNNDDKEILALLKDKAVIAIINKIDIAEQIHVDDLQEIAQGNALQISAKTSDGVKKLQTEIAKRLAIPSALPIEGVLLSKRQHEAARQAYQSLMEAKTMLASGEPDEVIVSLLRESLNSIGEITGKVTTDEILNNIFSKFCIGK